MARERSTSPALTPRGSGGPSTRAVHGGEARTKLGNAVTEPIVQKRRRSVQARKALVRAAISIGSPSGVPVPCASM